MKKRILFVCLGNICRSPAAEAVFIHLIKSKGLEDKFEVDSAGTGSWHVGHLADSRMRLAAEDRGIMITSLARQLKVNDLEQFDFILTMDKDNLAFVDQLFNSSAVKNPPLISPILKYASRTNLKEVPDPYYGGEGGFRNVLDLLEDACEGLLKELMKDY